jgi:plastocyanin
MRARAVLPLLFAVVILGSIPSIAETRFVHIRNCEFSPQPRFADPNDNVTWLYEEGGCPDNHRVTTYGSPPEDFDSGPCSGRNSFESTCLNTLPGRSASYTFRPSKPGNYPYYCPIHGELSADGQTCSGMCGLLKVNALPSVGRTTSSGSATARATASRSATASPTGSRSRSPSPSVSGTGTASVSPTGTSTILANKDRGDGGGRVAIAVAAVALLGTCALLVWRAFIAQQT